jgi:hypothetical protein
MDGKAKREPALHAKNYDLRETITTIERPLIHDVVLKYRDTLR